MRISRLLLQLALVLMLPLTGLASTASKNKEGNRLFQEGKYQEAEKAYLDAQVESPDRPELRYNLGNTFIKQKKYEDAAQSLRQAIARGDKELQANSWFNIGNALYEAQNFSDSAQAFIQSLRINPSDREAKHNLELALKKLKEQQQNQQNPRQDQSKQQPEQKADAGNREEQSRQDKGNPQGQDNRPPEDSPRTANPESTRAERRDGSFDKERALQILDALQNQEIAEQRKLLERRARQKTGGKDW